MSDMPNPNDPELMYEHRYDMSQEVPIAHRFDHIVGNELRCSLHDGCVSIRVKPTEVLEKGQDGQLHLVDKAP